MIKKSQISYRIIDGAAKILEDNLTAEAANYLFGFLSFDLGIDNLKIEEYFPVQIRGRLGRDIDLY